MKHKDFSFRITRERIAKWLRYSLVQRTCVVLLSFLVVYIYAVLALNINFLSPVANVMKDFSMTDIYYHINWSTMKPDTSRIVTIVDMSDKYYRSDIAQCIEDIESCHPKVLGVDALFEGDRDDLEANMQLMETIASYDNIVCSYILGDYVDETTGYKAETCQHAFFKDYIQNVDEGYTNMPRNLYGGMKRQVPLGTRIDGRIHPSFCQEVCNKFIASDSQPTAEKTGQSVSGRGTTADQPLPLTERTLDINFSPKEFVVLQPKDVKSHPELIADRVVLFGSMHETVDMHYTPIGKMAGVKLLAYATETVLAQNEIRQLPSWAFAFLTFAIVFLIRYIEEKFTAWTQHHRNPFVRYFVGSSYGVGILIFLITVVLMGLFYGIYSLMGVSISLAIPLAASAFLNASHGFYKALQQSVLPHPSHNSHLDDEENIMHTMHRDDAMSDDAGTTSDSLQDFGER